MRVDETGGLKKWLIIMSLTFFVTGVIVFLVLWQIDVVPIEHFKNSSKILTPKEFIELKRQGINSVIEALKIVATTFGGAAILFNVYYAARRAKAMDDSAIAANKSADAALDNAKAALKNAEAAQDKQITERFTKAVEQLGSDNISIRLGGIYALERIANDSEKDHWTIMEVLTAFVREKAPFAKDSQKKLLDNYKSVNCFCARECSFEEIEGKRNTAEAITKNSYGYSSSTYSYRTARRRKETRKSRAKFAIYQP